MHWTHDGYSYQLYMYSVYQSLYHTAIPSTISIQFRCGHVRRSWPESKQNTYVLYRIYRQRSIPVTDWPSWWQLPHLRFLTVCGPPDHRSFSPWWKLLPFPLPFFLFGSDQLEFESPTDKPGSAFVSLGFTSAHMKKSHRLSWGFTQQKKSRPWLGPCLRVVLL